MKKEMIEVMLITLKARKRRAEVFVYNDKMIIEAKLLQAEIEALESELRRIDKLRKTCKA